MTTAELTDACGDEPGALCGWVYGRTSSEIWAASADWFIERPVRVLVLVVAGLIISRILRRSVIRFGEQVAARGERARLAVEATRTPGTSMPITNVRIQQRANTITSVLTSVVTILVWAVVGLLVLGQFDISLAPLLAGAGVLGVMLGFGAQHIVADFLAGAFMLIEDQFGVGDVVDIGEATGTVEKVSLRVTTIRDVNGTVWHVPNSQITRVANKSQLWSRAVLDIEVAYNTDLRQAAGIIQRVADDLWKDHEFTQGDIIDPPEVWGVERLGVDGVAIRLVVKTDPAEQWVVARELRLRIKEAFDEAGIEIPFPQRTLWIRNDQGLPRTGRSDVEVAEPRRAEHAEEFTENPEP